MEKLGCKEDLTYKQLQNLIREASRKLNKENLIKEASRKINKENFRFYPTSSFNNNTTQKRQPRNILRKTHITLNLEYKQINQFKRNKHKTIQQ